MKTSEKIWFDGKLIEWNQAKIHVLSHVIQYGSGVYEGIRMYDLGDKGSAVFRLHDHCKRLIESAKIYKMNTIYSQEEIENAVVETLKINKLKSAYIRPIIFRGYAKIGLDPLSCPLQVAIAAFEWGTYMGEKALIDGISACISSWSRPAPNTFPGLSKSCGQYLNSQLIRMEASEKGYHEGIAMDVNGFISEGSGENIFVYKDQVLYTPLSSDSILPGLTRDSIIKLANENNIKVVEKRIQRELLYIADEIFMTGTAAEVTPVTNVDGYVIGTGKRGKITEILQKKYFDLVTGKIEDSWNWLHYI